LGKVYRDVANRVILNIGKKMEDYENMRAELFLYPAASTSIPPPLILFN
jgi:hypothetical protein